ncbi:MAG: ankyrin repeat domain-containing protein [Candidatus Rhabdochlamydia sp.]
MVSPINNNLNYLSALIEKKENEELDRRSRIAAIDKVMRERVELTDDLIACQLEVIQILSAEPEEDRDFTIIDDLVQQRLEVIRENQVQSFNEVLAAREAYMENGNFFDLTREKKEEFRHQFQTSLNHSLAHFQENFSLYPTTNLKELENKLKLEREENLEIYSQMLDSKTPLTMECSSITAERAELDKLRRALIGYDATAHIDIWIAAEQGMTTYLQTELDKESFIDQKIFNKNSVVNRMNKEGSTPLHIAVLANQLDTVKWLLDNKANPNIKDSFGYHPLHHAAKMGNVSIAQALIAAKADINAKGNCERTPLHMAAHNGKAPVVALLMQQGVNVNAQTSEQDFKSTALHDAVTRQKIGTVAVLTKSPHLNVNIRDITDRVPLTYAILNGSLEIATLIVGHGSWHAFQNEQDPNHIKELMKLSPQVNQSEIEQFLKGLPNR